MKTVNNITALAIFALFFLECSYAREEVTETSNENTELASELEPADITFRYTNESIATIINQLAAEKNLNVIFPGDILNVQVTLHIEKKLTLTQAWDLLNTLLDVAGFFIIPQGSMIRVVKNGKEMAREPMPTYIGVDPTDLPNNDQPIRYLYYFANMKVSGQEENEINGILKDILPDGMVRVADTATNGLLLVAKSNDIRGVMKILLELDKIDFQEKVDILSLHHVAASNVANIINELVKSESPNPYRLDTKKAKNVPYFSGFTKVVALDKETHLNKVLLLGRPQAIQRLKDFIIKYIDVAPDTGESILHVYHLQYLNARDLESVLKQIIQGGGGGGPNQSSAGGGKKGGTERAFENVIIHTDYPEHAGGDNANTKFGEQEFSHYGGNNLVIAARNDDWKQIKKLIEDLDIPQKQVLIEVLIADLTIDDARLLGSMTRVPDKISIPDDMSFQSAMLGQVIPTELPGIPTTNVDSNLLANAYNASGVLVPTADATNNLANFATSGTTLLSLNDNDGRTWSILEILQSFTNSKILSHPHIVTRTNKKAEVTIGQTRWLRDQVKDISGNFYGGATTIKYKPISANLVVKITPRISSANTVNLQVSVDINEWQANPDNVKDIRQLETNANVKNGGIFVLGGLIRTNIADTINEVPILGRIPILGWFFKRKAKTVIKNNLTVFISPTIIEPRLRAGLNEHTQDYIDLAKDYSRENMFDSLKDPITRWFFQGNIDAATAIDVFTQEDEPLTTFKRVAGKENKKTENPDLDAIDSTDKVQREAGISITANEQQQLLPEQLPDLKSIIQDDPNPFLKT